MSLAHKKIINPLPKAVRDPDKVSQFYNKHRLMPYYGADDFSSHKYLKLLYDLAALSPTKNKVINFFLDFGFDGKIDLMNSQESCLVFDEEQTSLTDEQKKSIVERLKEYDWSFRQLCDINIRQVKDNRICGNFSMVYEEYELAGVKKFFTRYLSPKHWMYVAPKKKYDPFEAVMFKDWQIEENDGLIVSDEFENRKKKKFEKIAVYPEWTKTPRGRKTLFHEANFSDSDDLYGRPPDPAALFPQFVEYANLDLSCKISNKAIVTQYVIMVQKEIGGIDFTKDEDGEDCQKNDNLDYRRKQQVRGLMGRNGKDPETIAFFEYEGGEGSQAPKGFPITLKKDTAWFKCQREWATKDILGINGVPAMLAGETAKGSIGSSSSNIMDTVFKINAVTTIKGEQNKHSRFWDNVFSVIADFTGIEELKNSTVKFTNKIQDVIDSDNNERRSKEVVENI